MEPLTEKRRGKILESVKHFPSMMKLGARVLPLLADEEAWSFTEVEKILRMDPGLTANFLKLANSAYFGFSGKIGSVKHAMMLLGSARLKQVVVATCVKEVLNAPVPGYDLQPGDLWRHSIAVSVATEFLAKEIGLAQVEEAFTAGLVHDSGKLILGAHVKEELEVMESETSRGVPFHEAEQQVLGTDHAAIGAMLLESWSFPNPIVSAVRWHHAPDKGPASNPLTDLVHIADVLCLVMGVGIGREGLRYEASVPATKRLGLKAKTIEKVAVDMVQWVEAMAHVF